MDQERATPPQLAPRTYQFSPRQTRPDYSLWLILGAALLAIVIIVIVAVVGLKIILSSFKMPSPPPAPLPPTPEVKVAPKSPRFATDAGVLKLREDLVSLGAQIDSVDLIEPQISPPALDLSIGIEPESRN